jgi:anti-sigma factor (TIGR02949 family)
MECTEVLKVMYEAADNPDRLKPSPEAKEHVQECANCQKLLSLDQSVKAVVSRKAAGVAVPPGLATRISQQIKDLESLSWKKKLSWLLPGRPWGWIGSAAVMAAALLVIALWTLSFHPSVVNWFLEEHAEYVEEGSQLDIVSSDPGAVDAWFEKTIGFPANAAHLLVTGLELRGGKKLEFAGQASALACLKKGETLVSVYAVSSSNLKIEKLESRKVGGKEVWVGSKDEFNIVVWQDLEKNQTWSAVAALPLSELLALAEAA